MPNTAHPILTVLPEDATGVDLSATVFVALELSLTRWVVAASTPGEQKISQRVNGALNLPHHWHDRRFESDPPAFFRC